MHVDETGHGDFVGGEDFPRTGRQTHSRARPDRLKHTLAEEQTRAGDFSLRSDRAAHMEKNVFHGQESIVAEILSRTKQNGRGRSLARRNEHLSSNESGYF